MANFKIAVVGKKNHIPWPFYVYRGLLQNNIESSLFYYNEYSIEDRLKKILFNQIDVDTRRFINFINLKKPSVIIFVSAFFIPKEYYYIAKEFNIKIIAWVGDSFDDSKQEFVNFIDKLYLFDTSLVEQSLTLGFDSELLQVGYDLELHKNHMKERRETFNFIASYTKERENILQNLSSINLELYGTKWKKLQQKSKNWKIKNQKIDYLKLIDIYNSTKYALNITQMTNVNNGINMRIFETIACGSCLISDNLKDIPLCFEPQKEILVYNSTEELEELVDKLVGDKEYSNTIIKNAQNRLLKNDYTYKNRMSYVIKNLRN